MTHCAYLTLKSHPCVFKKVRWQSWEAFLCICAFSSFYFSLVDVTHAVHAWLTLTHSLCFSCDVWNQNQWFGLDVTRRYNRRLPWGYVDLKTQEALVFRGLVPSVTIFHAFPLPPKSSQASSLGCVSPLSVRVQFLWLSLTLTVQSLFWAAQSPDSLDGWQSLGFLTATLLCVHKHTPLPDRMLMLDYSASCSMTTFLRFSASLFRLDSYLPALFNKGHTGSCIEYCWYLVTFLDYNLVHWHSIWFAHSCPSQTLGFLWLCPNSCKTNDNSIGLKVTSGLVLINI